MQSKNWIAPGLWSAGISLRLPCRQLSQVSVRQSLAFDFWPFWSQSQWFACIRPPWQTMSEVKWNAGLNLYIVKNLFGLYVILEIQRYTSNSQTRSLCHLGTHPGSAFIRHHREMSWINCARSRSCGSQNSLRIKLQRTSQAIHVAVGWSTFLLNSHVFWQER